MMEKDNHSLYGAVARAVSALEVKGTARVDYDVNIGLHVTGYWAGSIMRIDIKGIERKQ